jgi:membrane protease YdiL (CAAX protease family)
MYFKTYLLVVLVFAVNYALTWLLITKPDFTLMSFTDQFKGLGIDMTLPMPAINMIGIFALITFIGAPIANMISSLGEEIGWRGFLLPNLEGLGQTKAVIISGMIWALWHTPMILILGFTYGAQAWSGVLLHFAVVTGIGIWMGYVWFKTRSTILTAFIHAVFNANAYGVWTMLFVSDNKLMVGAASLIGAVLCLGVGVGTLWVMRGNNKLIK